jgi:hypothetical protein
MFTGNQFSIIGGSMVEAPKRYSSRFVAVGYFLDPQATTAGGSSVSATGIGAGRAGCTPPPPPDRIKAGAVAGLAFGMFKGTAMGVVVMCFLFIRKRRAEVVGYGGYLLSGRAEMCGVESVKRLLPPIEMNANMRRELRGRTWERGRGVGGGGSRWVGMGGDRKVEEGGVHEKSRGSTRNHASKIGMCWSRHECGSSNVCIFCSNTLE